MEDKIKTPYEKVMLARDKDRLKITDYIDALFDDFVELKGDGITGEDSAILGGIAFYHGLPVTVIGHKKGSSTEENIDCNFGMASPEGYRKAARLMKQAEKFNRPVITIVDTPGAYPGLMAEANGQANAIAENLALMSSLKVPIIAVITGEGSSGGALGIAVADRVFMLENAVYSILSPEGFASILWKDSKKADEAATLMKLTATELLNYGIIDGIITEGSKLIINMDEMISRELTELTKLKEETLLKNRYKKFREIDKEKRAVKA
ncbi:acetyl-CoA carboxylase carboxyl transferase subunit alpha [Catonella massiliensis]|uniref:acetyl-CoA carboxytransferase n=1 Tax=Catonella massiliensis TaxID=2799636 RepID=A0ABS1J089_9FIRM|nr:acetyl-CoA carboxylase carboxyl transferase subunit alpha [Catonella massiliensis]MBK5897549.1 acetyl-CoA carboxylase carboxyl transferase subunit alpha [Catonella massiliensis]